MILLEEIKKLQSAPGKPVYEIGDMRSLIATVLIVEYQLIVHPVITGKGETIFNGAAQHGRL
jgi:hypothetical protein